MWEGLLAATYIEIAAKSPSHGTVAIFLPLFPGADKHNQD
ncbi:hypothetical protein BPUTEOMOX_743 [methanotrophic endosymbiont of Bathymodiolus puteoserpentis (Logatchev)]|nr:hypothetical protein BPUTEOMOX_743 [methanotrophic endosymbiont of Bathymodiolus puteoserpentis (Logatchev)]